MEDQVTQNDRVEAEEYRNWTEFTEAERAAALRALGRHMAAGNPRWSQAAIDRALFMAYAMDMQRGQSSPIRWGELSPQEMKTRLLEIAEWNREDGITGPAYLRDACLDAAEDLRRQQHRIVSREGRSR